MFGILTTLKKMRDPNQSLYYILGNASLVFSNQNLGTPNPQFNYLFRQKDQNPESVDKDSAHILYYLSKQIQAKVAIEVGIYRGAGSLHLSQAVNENGGTPLHLIDISSTYLDDVQSKLTTFGFKSTPHMGRSDDRTIISKLPVADIIFLDADHGYTSVKRDVDSYWPLIRKNGVLVIHDTVMWPGARMVANELCAKGFNITTLATSGGAGISIVRK